MNIFKSHAKNKYMRTSTKIFMVLFFITLVGSVLTGSFFFNSIIISENGIAFNPSIMAYVSIVIGILNAIFSTILYVRFLRSQKYNSIYACR